MNILGIHDGHNANASFVSNGEIIAAVEEERVSRKKNHAGIPFNLGFASHPSDVPKVPTAKEISVFLRVF